MKKPKTTKRSVKRSRSRVNGAIKAVPRRLRKPKTVKDPDAGVQPLEAVDLGPLLIPEGDEASDVLRKAAELNDRAVQAHKAYVEQAERAKQAKRHWQDLVSELQQHVRLHTHESTLPLLQDIEQRERDQRAMEAAGDGR